MESRGKKKKIALQVLVIFSEICALATILVISPGIIYVFKIPYIAHGVPVIIYLVPIGCAILIAVLGVVGWCGALDIHRSCIFGYALSTLVVMVAQLYLIVFYYPVQSNPYIKRAKREITEAWSKYEKDGNIKIHFRHLELNWECCGLNSFNDYNQTDLPISCCHNLIQCSVREAYPRGCLQTYCTDLFIWLKSGFIVVVFSCCIQLITSVLSFFILCTKSLPNADVANRNSIRTTRHEVEMRSAATTPTVPVGATISPGEVRAKILDAIEKRHNSSATPTSKVPHGQRKTERLIWR